MIAAILYVLSVLLANLLASTFVEMPFGALIAVGTLFFGATFTLRDFMHRKGRPFVYKAIGVALLVNVLAALATQTPLRIIIASFISIALAESADTEVFQALLRKSWTIRVLSSNLVSIPLDTILFTLLAFHGDLPAADIQALIVGDMALKFAIATLIMLFHPKRQQKLATEGYHG